MPEPQVRRATEAEIPAMAAVLARAFARDPFFSWLAGDAPERNLRMRMGWAAILRNASAGLRETWTTADVTGVAIWVPPGRGASSFLDSLRMIPALARLAGWRRLREVAAATELLEQRRLTHVPAPHWYLSALGVDPDRQRQGIGSALLRLVLDRADEEGTSAYLETATARNVLLYERHGFDVVEELSLPRTDIRGWLMLRPPAASGSSVVSDDEPATDAQRTTDEEAPMTIPRGTGTRDDPWVLTTAPGTSEYTMYRDDAADPPQLVCQVGSTKLTYLASAIDDLHAWLREQGDWVPLGAADEQKPAAGGTVEAWGRSDSNPAGGWYGLRKGYRGRFGMYLPPLLEALGLVELEHNPRNNRVRAR
jgi:ribosomal protein S18 acetylase RimI-like enzyme